MTMRELLAKCESQLLKEINELEYVPLFEESTFCRVLRLSPTDLQALKEQGIPSSVVDEELYYSLEKVITWLKTIVPNHDYMEKGLTVE